MRQAGFIRAWLKSIEDAAYQYAVVQRNPFPGHKVVQANPKREWAADAETTAIGLAKITGAQPSAFLKTSCVGITEAEGVIKQLAKKVPNPEDITRAFSLLTVKRSSGTLSLVPDSDKRPAYDAAKEAFVGVVPSGFDEG
jgi:hypothetical protein